MCEYGMPTLIELPKIEDCAILCKKLGLSFIEINFSLPQYLPKRIDTDKLNEIAKKYGIFYTIHADENLNPCEFSDLVSSAYVETMRETIEVARKINATKINMHLNSGICFTTPDKKLYLFEEYFYEYMKKQEIFNNVCELDLHGYEIKICIENTGGFKPFMQKAIETTLKSDCFGLTFDIGHNHCINGTDEDFILSRKDKLMHFHVHDAIKNDKVSKDHLVHGTGNVDLHKYLNIAEETGSTVVLETKTVDGLTKTVDWMKRCKYM